MKKVFFLFILLFSLASPAIAEMHKSLSAIDWTGSKIELDNVNVNSKYGSSHISVHEARALRALPLKGAPLCDILNTK